MKNHQKPQGHDQKKQQAPGCCQQHSHEKGHQDKSKHQNPGNPGKKPHGK